MRNIPFEDQTKSFVLSLGQGVYIFEESPNSIQDVIGDVYCPGKYCSNREKCESLGGFVTTLRSIYGCGKCGVWLFVHKLPFELQEHVKTTKTDETRFFFANKRCTCYPTNNCSLMSHFNQPNLEGKNCVWTTKYKRLLQMCIVQHVEMKSVFTFQPIKLLVSTTVKSAKLAFTFNQNVIFCVQIFLPNLLFEFIIFFKNVHFTNVFFLQNHAFKKIFFFKIRHVVKILSQNLTRCIIFVSKSDAL